jgi:hypothetical protein
MLEKITRECDAGQRTESLYRKQKGQDSEQQRLVNNKQVMQDS